MKRIALFLCTAALLFWSPRAHAGAKSEFANCITNTNGSGYCYGTFLGFRDNADPNAYVQFFETVSKYRSFGAYLNGHYYNCLIKANVGYDDMWPGAMSNRGEFFVAFGTDGYCSSLNIYNSSMDSNY